MNKSIRPVSFCAFVGGLQIIRVITLMALGAVLPMGAGAQNVIINEFMADNYKSDDPANPSYDALVDQDGQASDWIELYNAESTAVNLAGWSLTDDPAEPRQWIFPATNIAAKSYLIVFASGKDYALHANFALSAAGGYLALVRPDLTVASAYENYPDQHTSYSYGVGQVVTPYGMTTANNPVRVFVPRDNSLGTFWINNQVNETLWIKGTNGVGYESSVPGFLVKYYRTGATLGNLTTAESMIAANSPLITTNASVINYNDPASDGHYGANKAFPGQTSTSSVDDFALEVTGTITIPSAGNWTFGVNSDDGFRLTISGNGFSNSILAADPRGPTDSLGVFNFPVAGDYSLKLVYFERGGGASVELFAAQGTYGAYGANFRLVGDTAGGGLLVRSLAAGGGTSGGYRSMIVTDLQSQMLNSNATVYLRYSFNITNPAFYSSMTMRVNYDDGFIAYLNGTEVARRNAPAGAAWNSKATAVHSATVSEDIPLTDQLGLLQTGTNLLSIQGLNISTNDADFFFKVELADYRVENETNQFFANGTPGQGNGTGIAGFVGDTKFSHDRGFYDGPFSLVITSATEGATIVYTTNGSVPALNNGMVYSSPIPINCTTTLRARAFKSPLQPSDADTQTYIFVDDVVRQSPGGRAPGAGWPTNTSSAGQIYDYGMDQSVVDDAVYGAEIREDLKALPTFSLVMNLPDLFDNGSGIYANPSGDERGWERPGSVELINGDGSKGFQINCGVRIRGGYSRSGNNPKHAFRLFFRQEYGAGKLHYPLFGTQGTDTFDKLDLRTMQNYSWSFDGSGAMICNRDLFARDAQLAMGHQATRGNFYHLYVNGQYWGIYNTEERGDAAFGETYIGGKQEDYDVIKVDPDLGYNIEATDGNTTAWQQLWLAAINGFASDADYFRIQGLNVDGTRNPAYPVLLDVDNLIDYMLVILYGGNLDAPISNFLGNSSPNNYFTYRNRTGEFGGFRFLAHDSEHTLLDVNSDRTGIDFSGNISYTAGGTFEKSNPQHLWFKLQANKEFRLKVADHIQRHMFNRGVLSVQGATALMNMRSNQLYRPIVCESARWGDSKRPGSAYTRQTWLGTWTSVMASFINGRTPVLLAQLKADGFYPSNNIAPSINSAGGMVAPGYAVYLTNVNASGTLFYTLDGSDPRLPAGEVSPRAMSYEPGTAINVNSYVVVKARSLIGTNDWSALIETVLYPSQTYTNLLITEIMYNPVAQGGYTADLLEFLEFKNTGTTTLDLSGLYFSEGITFGFTNGARLEPGQFLVIGRDRTALSAVYPGLNVYGLFSGRLDNAGETLTLMHFFGGRIMSFGYKDSGRWPVMADGQGFSIVPKNPNSNPDPGSPFGWRASTQVGGSPGADDPVSTIAPVVINEALTHSELPDVDQVELYNPNAFPVDISGWFLTDDRLLPRKYRIPEGRIIDPFGFMLFTEADFNATPGLGGSFGLDASGDQIYLLSGDASTNLTGYSHGFSFDAAESMVTFGRYVNSIGEEHFVAQSTNSLAGTNAYPLVGPMVMKQIMYHPYSPTTNDNTLDEYIELLNISGQTVSLFDTNVMTNTWHLRGGIEYNFPTNVTVPAGGSIILVNFNPTNEVQLTEFRNKFPLFAGIPVFGPYSGKLSNGDDDLLLTRPDAPTTNNVPRILVEEVHYRDSAPWPPAADGTGRALLRRNFAAYGNDPANWTDAMPLSIQAQPISVTNRVGSNVTFTVDARGEGILAYQWRFNGTNISTALNPTATNATLLITNVTPAAEGVYTVAVSDGVNSILSAPASFTPMMAPIIVRHPNHVTVAVGSPISTSVGAKGLPMPLYFKWKREAADVTNIVTYETNCTLVIPSAALNNAGDYTVTVTNEIKSAGLTSSQRGLVTVVVPPASVTVSPGTNLTLRATVSGGRFTTYLRYQWQFNGTNLPGATTTNLVLNNLQESQLGTYSLFVTNASNYVASFDAQVTTGAVDSNTDGIPDWWASQYGFSVTEPIAGLDPDGDRMSNAQEFLAGTDPTDGQSYLRVDLTGTVPEGGAVLSFMAVSNRAYKVLANDLLPGSWSEVTNFTALPTNRVTTWTNAAPGSINRFYRLEIPAAP